MQRTFPRTARMAEVTFYLKGLIDLPEAEELLAPVIGQGMHARNARGIIQGKPLSPGPPHKKRERPKTFSFFVH